MKHAKFMVSVIALASIVCGARAIKLCQLDWLNAWKNASGILPHSRRSYTQGNYDTTGNGSGRWAVTSDQGSTGVYHTVSGESLCSDTNSGTYTNGSPSLSSTTTNNGYCWCRMSTPNLGASWVFVNTASGSAAACAHYCAYGCAVCFDSGSYGSCARSVVLTLP
jgi:hypothetical protein